MLTIPRSKGDAQMRKMSVLWLMFLFYASSIILAQDYSQLDPNPYDPKKEPDPDMFIASWKESMPRHTHGSLIERDIFTPCEGDPLRPVRRGAVLEFLKRFVHGTLNAHTTTAPTKLEGEQEIFYISSGKGTMKAGGKTADLYDGIGVLMPPGLEFTMTNTGDEPLTMYIMVEPVTAGAQTRKDMLVRDENVITPTSSNVHWTHIYKTLFSQRDGLTILSGMGPVWFDPMTMGQPHSHGEGVEEIWFVLKGDVNLLLGKNLRKITPGMAYKIPPDGLTPHSNINVTDEPLKLFWLMRVPPR
jgi:mannose-6-phosphate isomerase-like protein (cupin superfamily)